MQVELSRGQTVDLREKLKAHDRFAVQGVIMLNMTAEGTPAASQSGGMVNIMRNALLANLIQSWTVTAEDGTAVPIPKEAPADEQGVRQDVLGELDIDDYNKLADAVEPLLNKVLNVPNRNAPSGS